MGGCSRPGGLAARGDRDGHLGCWRGGGQRPVDDHGSRGERPHLLRNGHADDPRPGFRRRERQRRSRRVARAAGTSPGRRPGVERLGPHAPRARGVSGGSRGAGRVRRTRAPRGPVVVRGPARDFRHGAVPPRGSRSRTASAYPARSCWPPAPRPPGRPQRRQECPAWPPPTRCSTCAAALCGAPRHAAGRPAPGGARRAPAR